MSKIDTIQAMVNFELRGYQREILEATEENQQTAFYLGRRMGKSTLICLDAIYNARTESRPTQILIATHNVNMRNNLFETILEYSRGFATRIRNSDIKEACYGNNVIRVISCQQSNNRYVTHCQNADIVYIDEADFISNDAIEHCILPITNTNMNCRTCMMSTVSGVAGTYFKQVMTDRNLTHIYTDTFNAFNVGDMDIYIEPNENDWVHLGYKYLTKEFYIRYKKEITRKDIIYET